jgi:hypothetical protein
MEVALAPTGFEKIARDDEGYFMALRFDTPVPGRRIRFVGPG